MAKIAELLATGREKVEEFLRHGVDTWVSEGRIDGSRRDLLYSRLNTPDVEAAFLHAGAHFAISIPLRFPFGATARFLYTLALRVKAEVSGLVHRSPPVQARRCHTALVMVFALLPGFGRLAYFLSPALAGERLLLVIPLDQVSRKLPFKTYQRLHLDALFVYWAHEPEPRRGFRHFLAGGWFEDLRERMGAVAAHGRLVAAVLTIDAAALLIGAYIYADSGRTAHWWFDEGNVMATIDVAQLVLASVAGFAGYRMFWRIRRSAPPAEAAGIFLWGFGAIGLLVFAIDDYIGLHESLGRSLAGGFGFLPLPVNMPDDLLVLGYAVVGVVGLYIFHMEVFANRASATLLQLAAVASIVMVLTDAFATSLELMALEYPAQTFAKGLLALAFVVRFREITAKQPEPVADARSPRTA